MISITIPWFAIPAVLAILGLVPIWLSKRGVAMYKYPPLGYLHCLFFWLFAAGFTAGYFFPSN